MASSAARLAPWPRLDSSAVLQRILCERRPEELRVTVRTDSCVSLTLSHPHDLYWLTSCS